jgi:hypothetical protein
VNVNARITKQATMMAFFMTFSERT